MGDVTIKIDRKVMYVFVGIAVLLVGVGLVVGYGSGNPAVMGHSSDEVESTLDSSCLVDEIMVKTSSGWACETVPEAPEAPVIEECVVLYPYSSSDIVANNIWEKVKVPDMCKGSVCHVMFVLYNSDGVVDKTSAFEISTLYQHSSGYWRSKGSESTGVVNVNGDRVEDGIASHNDGSNKLYDDYYNKDHLDDRVVEESADYWVIRDTNKNHATELIVCP